MTDKTDALVAQPEQIEIYVCWTNTNLTDGYGYMYPYAWAETKATARRLAKGKGVQGCDAEVKPSRAFRVGRQVYGPVRVETPSKDDEERQAAIDARTAAIEKAKAAGLTDDELSAITGGER